ncbi:exocyst complex component sec6 [Pholiota molesta]|nr:exocyst complex component sec6 [Pholiota molesta]
MAAPVGPVSAAQAIGEYLQSPDDLVKVSAFRKKLEKEKASIDTRLNNGVKEQLQATRLGLRKFLSTRDNVQAIKDEMMSIEKECDDPSVRVATFDQISSLVHRNFESTEEMVNNLLDMASQLDDLEQMLAADSRDIIGPAPNLLVIHFQLNQLERFRNTTMHQAKKASPSSQATLTRWFERLNKLIAEFDEYILKLASNVLNLIRGGYADVVVRMLKVAEVEGKEDEKTVVMRFVKKAAKLDAALKFKSLQADARVLKHYRSKIIKAITQSIHEKVQDAYKRSEDNPVAFLGDLMKWLLQDIYRVETDVVPCFPADYEIYSLYLREYHKALNSVVKTIAGMKSDASVLLSLFEWLKEYKRSMKELDVPPELLEPPLLDGKEQALIEDYVKLIIQKLDEWSANLMKTEVAEFIKREQPPEIDSDGLYGTQGGVILFQMVNQQIDLATESGQGAILARVVSETNRVMRGIQDQWAKVVDAEFKKQIEKPEEATGGLVEYCIALANDQIKSADFGEALLARVEPLVSAKYQGQINERLNNAIDGYLDIAKKCMQTLIDTIFNDLKPATKNLFQPPWYDGIMRQIVETMRDYMNDYQSYLNSVYSTCSLRLFRYFGPAADVEARFQVLEMILSMLEASKDIAFLSFWSFAKVHGPNIAFVEGLMKSRSDFDRSTVSDIMDSIKRKVKDEGLTDPPEPTIMKKVNVQNAFTRFLRT